MQASLAVGDARLVQRRQLSAGSYGLLPQDLPGSSREERAQRGTVLLSGSQYACKRNYKRIDKITMPSQIEMEGCQNASLIWQYRRKQAAAAVAGTHDDGLAQTTME